MKIKEVVPPAYYNLYAVIKKVKSDLISPFRLFSLHGILKEKSYLVCGPFANITECSVVCGKNEIEIEKSICSQFNIIIIGHINKFELKLNELPRDFMYNTQLRKNVYLLIDF